MGLISWIKEKHNNYQLSVADSKAKSGEVAEAERIYKSILEVHELAVVHLANLYVNNSPTNELMLRRLNDIEQLNRYVNDSNSSEYRQELQSMISRIFIQSDKQFNAKNYSWAVKLLESIKTHKAGSQEYNDKLHRYKAYLSWSAMELSADYKADLKSCISELKQYSSKLADLIEMNSGLCNKGLYHRSFLLLLPFVSINNSIKQAIVECAVKIVGQKDKDLKSIDKISSFCKDNEIAKLTASALATDANNLSKQKKYKEAVTLCSFAAEFLSDDNSFNNNRCKYILEELSGRANAQEIRRLLALAKQLNLSNNQIKSLENRILLIAENAEPAKALEICKIFKQTESFEKIYIEKTKALCMSGYASYVNCEELLEIIRNNSNEDNFVEYLAKFVNYLPSFEDIYITSCTEKIIRDEDITLLSVYWNIKKSSKFFSLLINKDSSIARNVIDYVAKNHSVFFTSSTYRNDFLSSVKSLSNEEILLSTLEKLLAYHCDVKSCYISEILNLASSLPNEEAIQYINRGIDCINDESLINEKIKIIHSFIKSGLYDEADAQAYSLISKDKEGAILVAESNKSRISTISDPFIKIEWIVKGLEVLNDNQFSQNNCPIMLELLNQYIDSIQEIHSSGNTEKAYALCDGLKKYSRWTTCYLKLRLKDLKAISGIAKRLSFIQDTIATTFEKKTEEVADPYQLDILCNDYHELIVNKANSQPKNKAIESLSEFRSFLTEKANHINSFNELLDNVSKLINKKRWELAVEMEEECSFPTAIDEYMKLSEEGGTIYSKRAKLRSYICILKSGKINSVDEEGIKEILKLKSFESIKEDLAFRYALYLLGSTRPAEAENILRTHLPEEKELLSFCENIYIKEAEDKLKEFNEKIDNIINGTMSADDALLLLRKLGSYHKAISDKLPDTSQKIKQQRSKIESYIIRSLFADERYSEAYKRLVSIYPNYLDNDIAYRNIAIASLGILEANETDDETIKRSIAIWISAVYTDRLFVESLAYTSWDDQYTFTLSKSLGASKDYEYDVIPDNVNYDEAIENKNISIRDVQNSLLIRLETIIRNQYPNYESFYNKEKNAISSLIELNLDENCTLITPYLALLFDDAYDSINHALENEYEQDYGNQETILALGVTYGLNGSYFIDYREEKNKADKFILALNNSPQALSRACSSIKTTKKYSNLFSAIKSAALTKINEAIKVGMLYSVFLSRFEKVCNSLNETDLSLTCANYVNGQVIHRLNTKELKESEGIGYLVRAYNLAPSNIQVKNNIEAILGTLVEQHIKNDSRQAKKAIDQVLLDTGKTFKKTIDLATILHKVINDKLDKDDALDEVYDIYLSHKNDDEVCDLLVALCIACINTYIIGNYLSYSVQKKLDKIYNNRSARFIDHSGDFANEFAKQMDRLSDHNRIVIMMGINLNDDGVAFRRGLSYFAKFAKPGTLPQEIVSIFH